MKKKELQMPKDAAAELVPEKTEPVPARKKRSAAARKEKREPAQKTKASPAQKAAAAKKTFRKRKKQYQHMMTLLRMVIRIVNAASRGTLYRK